MSLHSSTLSNSSPFYYNSPPATLYIEQNEVITVTLHSLLFIPQSFHTFIFLAAKLFPHWLLGAKAELSASSFIVCKSLQSEEMASSMGLSCALYLTILRVFSSVLEDYKRKTMRYWLTWDCINMCVFFFMFMCFFQIYKWSCITFIMKCYIRHWSI